MIKRLALPALLALALAAAACTGGSNTNTNTEGGFTSETFTGQVVEPTPEGELGSTTALGEFRSVEERGFGVPQEVAIGETLVVEEVIKVTLIFLSVVEDTRCPEGETCDDPGRAAINVSVRAGGLLMGETEFALEGGVAGDPRRMGGNLNIQLLDLQPLPNADGSEVTDYVATLQLTR